MFKNLFFIVAVLFAGCATKQFTHKQSKIVTIKSPEIKFNDIGYIKHDTDYIELELYSVGVAIDTIKINRLICVKDGCMSKSSFNEKYLNKAYPDDTIKDILMSKPIFSGKNLQKTNFGFIQKIKSKDYNIIYKVSKNETYFKDKKNHIIFKLKDMDE